MPELWVPVSSGSPGSSAQGQEHQAGRRSESFACICRFWFYKGLERSTAAGHGEGEGEGEGKRLP